MRVALVNARKSWSTVTPTGLLSIATVLKEDGHAVRVFDAYYSDEEVLRRLEDFEPELVGFSFLTTEYVRAKKLIEAAHARLPNAVLCAGGYHATALPERTLRELSLDFVVMSEGEMTLLEICRRPLRPIELHDVRGVAFLEAGGQFVQTPPRPFIADLDDLPIIDRELLDGGMDWYLTLPGNVRNQLIPHCTTILTSRGCPGNCLFCSSRAMWTSHVRQRSADNVLDEICHLRDAYGVRGLFFLDDTFTASKSWVLDFCARWKARHLKMTWGCSARVNTVDEEMLRAMKEIGCVQLDFGVESGNDEVLRTLHKGQNQKVILRAFEAVHRCGLSSLACFIIGSPGETEQQMRETLNVAKTIHANFNIFSILTPLPGSPLYDMAIKNGWITGHEDFGMDWSIRHSEMPVMGIEAPAIRLLEIRKEFEDQFVFRNYAHYFWPLLLHPWFVLMLFYQFARKPRKYANLLFGKASRKYSGIVESLYYDYKEHAGGRHSRRRRARNGKPLPALPGRHGQALIDKLLRSSPSVQDDR